MNDVPILLGLLIPIIPVAWQAWQYLDKKKQEIRDRRFSTYHELIRRLVEPDAGSPHMKLDRQIAVVFELRNFEEYAEVTVRILKGVRSTWSDSGSKRLLEEIDLTIAHLEAL